VRPLRGRRRTLTSAAVKLARLLGPDECLLIGGLAVGVHGYVRATDDLDFITRQSLSHTQEKLQGVGIETRLLRGDALDGGFSCLKGEIDGIPFDVLPPLVPIAWDQALTLAVAGGRLRVVDLDGLLQLKFRAAGPQDLLDAARLVLAHPAVEARARELATAYRERQRFEVFFNDPRTRAQAREEAERERRAAEKPVTDRSRRREESRTSRKQGPRRHGAHRRASRSR
jgi:hypothetical protein